MIGALVCIVGRVGTGKTALLSGMINEMRQVYGHVIFGGPVSYGESCIFTEKKTY
jgi:ATP-binding cassette subfamily C (CFTR/MRP) protein 1